MRPVGASVRHKSAVKHDYTGLASTYEARWQSFNTVIRSWVLREWPGNLGEAARVLDLGCGTGGFLRAVASAWPGLELVGLDITPALLTEARRNAPTARYVEGDVDAPPFAASSFDVVCSLNVAHHLGDLDTHVATLARLCRPGGSVFLSTFAGGRTLELRIVNAWLKWTHSGWAGMWSPDDVRQAIASVPGLAIQRSDERRSGVWRLQVYRLGTAGRPGSDAPKGTSFSPPWPSAMRTEPHDCAGSRRTSP